METRVGMRAMMLPAEQHAAACLSACAGGGAHEAKAQTVASSSAFRARFANTTKSGGNHDNPPMTSLGLFEKREHRTQCQQRQQPQYFFYLAAPKIRASTESTRNLPDHFSSTKTGSIRCHRVRQGFSERLRFGDAGIVAVAERTS